MEIYNLLNSGFKFSYHHVVVPLILTILILDFIRSYYKFFSKEKQHDWFFALNINKQRLVVFLVYLVTFFFFYYLGHIEMVDKLYLVLSRSMFPLSSAVQDDQNKQQDKDRKGKGKMAATTAQHEASTPAQDDEDDKDDTSFSTQSSEKKEDFYTGERGANNWGASSSRDHAFRDYLNRATGDKDPRKRSAHDWKASESGDQPDLATDPTKNIENIQRRLKKIVVNRPPKPKQGLPSSSVDPGEQINVSYESLGNTLEEAGKNLAKFFTPERMKKMQDKKRRKKD